MPWKFLEDPQHAQRHPDRQRSALPRIAPRAWQGGDATPGGRADLRNIAWQADHEMSRPGANPRISPAEISPEEPPSSMRCDNVPPLVRSTGETNVGSLERSPGAPT